MAGKRGPGRPRKDDAKRDGINIRLTDDEARVLDKISRKTGRSRTDILLDGVRSEIKRAEKLRNEMTGGEVR